MPEDQKAAVMRDFVKCFEDQDVDKALSLCTDDVCWHTPFGTFRGKEEVRKFLEWNGHNTKNIKFKETGSKIIVQGDQATFEHEISGVMQGEKVAFAAMCSYQFSGDQVKEMSTVYDRLSIAEQASSSWLPKKIVNTLVNQLHKGLD